MRVLLSWLLIVKTDWVGTTRRRCLSTVGAQAHVTLIPARADLPRHHRLADRTAGLFVMLAVEPKLAGAHPAAHLRKVQCQVFGGYIPQPKLARAGCIHQGAAASQREQHRLRR